MKRLAGVVISGVVLILLSLLQLVLAGLMVLGGSVQQRRLHAGTMPSMAGQAAVPAWTAYVVYAEGAVCAALAVWGILTAVGLFRTKRWARYSTLIIAGTLVFFGLCLMFGTMVAAVVGAAVAAKADPARAQAVRVGLLVFVGLLGLFEAALVGVGVFWLVYFNKKHVRDYFAGVTGVSAPSKRPLLIAVIAVLSIVGGVTCLLMMLVPWPGLFFGATLGVWQKIAVYSMFAALLGGSGVGLWRMEEWGRRLAIAAQMLAIAQNVFYVAFPSLLVRYDAEISARMRLPDASSSSFFQESMMRVMFGLSMLFPIAILLVLNHYGSAFARTTGPQEPASLELP